MQGGIETAALNFAALALLDAVKNAMNAATGVKWYSRSVVAIRPHYLKLDKTLKSAVLKIAKKYGIVKYQAINFTPNKSEKAIIIDLGKLNHVLSHVNSIEIGDSAEWGLALAGVTSNHTRGGDPSW